MTTCTITIYGLGVQMLTTQILFISVAYIIICALSALDVRCLHFCQIDVRYGIFTHANWWRLSHVIDTIIEIILQ